MEKSIKYWLREGRQSKVTSRIQKIVDNFDGCELEKTYQALDWVANNLHHEKSHEKSIKIFASRTADTIIKNKSHTGCHDMAVVLATLLRAINIPTKYLLGISKTHPSNRGHCVVEAYIGGRWILIDAGSLQLSLIPKKSSFYVDYYLLKEGLDSWNCGIKTFNDWKKVSQKVIKKVKEIRI